MRWHAKDLRILNKFQGGVKIARGSGIRIVLLTIGTGEIRTWPTTWELENLETAWSRTMDNKLEPGSTCIKVNGNWNPSEEKTLVYGCLPMQLHMQMRA